MHCIGAVLLAAAAAVVSCQEVQLMGEHDWLRSHVGDVQLAVPAHRLLVTSAGQGAVAGVSARTGDMKWRQVIQQDSPVTALTAAGSLVTAVQSGPAGQCSVRQWKATDGAAVFDDTVTAGPDTQLSQADGNGVSVQGVQGVQGVETIATCNGVVKAWGARGRPAWTWQPPSDLAAETVPVVTGMVFAGDHVYVAVATSDEGAVVHEVHMLDAGTGNAVTKNRGEVTLEFPASVASPVVLIASPAGACAAALDADGTVLVAVMGPGGIHGPSPVSGVPQLTAIVPLVAGAGKGSTAAPAGLEGTAVDGSAVLLLPHESSLQAVEFDLPTAPAGVFLAAAPAGVAAGAWTSSHLSVRVGSSSHTWEAGSPTAPVTAAWASAFSRKAGSGVRVAWKTEDLGLHGAAVLLDAAMAPAPTGSPASSTGSLTQAWSTQQALSAVTHTVTLEAAPAHYQTDAQDAGGIGDVASAIRDDPSFSLNSRLQQQVAGISDSMAGVMGALAGAVADPVGLLQRWASGSPTNRAVLAAMGVVVAAPAREAAPEAYAFDKTVVMAAKTGPLSGEIIALRGETGSQLWRVSTRALPVPQGAKVSGDMKLSLVVTRPHQAGSAAPEVAVVTSWAQGDGVVTWLDGWSGSVTAQQVVPGGISHTVPLPHAPQGSSTAVSILCFTLAGDATEILSAAAHVAPDSPTGRADLAAASGSLVAHVPHPGAPGAVVGLMLSVSDPQEPGSGHMDEIWRTGGLGAPVSLGSPQQRADGVVAPAGRPLGDDSVLLRYLSPHVVAAVTSTPGMDVPVSSADVEAGGEADLEPPHYMWSPASVSVKFLDSITGRTLYSKDHPGYAGPVHVTRVANWVVYSLWNEASATDELFVVAMFSGALGRHDLAPWSSTPAAVLEAESSFDRMEPQSFKSQAFVLPRKPVLLAATQTRQAITPQQVLVATEAGSVLALSPVLLDPRRPLGKPSTQDTAERLLQYTPYLPMGHQGMVTRNTTVPHISAIVSTPTALESTTLVLVVGLDVLAARHRPVKPFDVLPSEFNAPLLLAMMAALVVGTVYIRSLLMRKRLHDSWK